MLKASDYRAKAREALRGNWGLAVGTGIGLQVINTIVVYIVFFILALCGILIFGRISTYAQAQEITNYAYVAYLIIMFLVSFVTQTLIVGYYYFNLNLVRGEGFRFDNIFARFNKILKIFGLYFMIGLFTWLWTLLFFIPGIIAAFRYSMAPYIMADNPEIGIMEAIRKSKEMMKGYKWKYFCLQLSFLGWILLGIITLFIGMLWITPYIQASNAAFYLELSGPDEKSVEYEYNSDDE